MEGGGEDEGRESRRGDRLLGDESKPEWEDSVAGRVLLLAAGICLDRGGSRTAEEDSWLCWPFREREGRGEGELDQEEDPEEAEERPS